jgi:hypothetical protein
MEGATPYEALVERPAALEVVISIISGPSGSRFSMAGRRME